MPLYHTRLTVKPALPASSITKLIKKMATPLLSVSGVIRSIENHGIRPLPYRFKAKHMDALGNRYFTEGRFVSLFFDAQYKSVSEMERVIKLEEGVLRVTVMRAPDVGEKVRVTKAKKNPFL